MNTTRTLARLSATFIALVLRSRAQAQENAAGNHWENNGPAATGPIKEDAGLEPEYRDRLR